MRLPDYRRQWPPKTKDELRWWYRNHEPHEIAKVYGVAVVTLRWWWRKNGESPPKTTNWRKSFFSRIRKTKTCWIWTGSKNEQGYGFARNSLGKDVKAHRVSYEIFNGSAPPRHLLVLHSCDNPQCVNPSHLSLGTHQDNSDDCKRKGRIKSRRGEENGHAGMTENQVLLARRMASEGKKIRVIARELGVPYPGLWNAIRGKTWTWL